MTNRKKVNITFYGTLHTQNYRKLGQVFPQSNWEVHPYSIAEVTLKWTNIARTINNLFIKYLCFFQSVI